jgi:hypothetical protein
MAKSIRVITKQRGRPKTTGKGQLIGVRILPPLLKILDAWIREQDPRPSRPEAIRQIVEGALAQSSNNGPITAREAQKASDLASHAAEQVVDRSMPLEEQERRKRALIKGPKEFRELREGQSSAGKGSADTRPSGARRGSQ